MSRRQPSPLFARVPLISLTLCDILSFYTFVHIATSHLTEWPTSSNVQFLLMKDDFISYLPYPPSNNKESGDPSFLQSLTSPSDSYTSKDTGRERHTTKPTYHPLRTPRSTSDILCSPKTLITKLDFADYWKITRIDAKLPSDWETDVIYIQLLLLKDELISHHP